MANENKERFTGASFFTGIFCALIAKGRDRFPSAENKSLHAAFGELFENELQEEAESNNLDIRFCVKVRKYDVSKTVHGEIWGCVQRGILSVVLPSGKLISEFNIATAEKTLLNLPGTPEMYKRLAARFEELLHA